MSYKQGVGSLLLAGAIALGVTSVSAGTMFRLEIGPPVAGASGGSPSIKDAVLVVRPRACVKGDEPEQATITATAEGLVDGVRRSISLRLSPLQPAGVYAVERQWPSEGFWVVHLSGTCTPRNAKADALVPVIGTQFVRQRTQLLDRAASAAEVNAALRHMTAGTR